MTDISKHEDDREILEIQKLKVEVNKIIAETRKINTEQRWYLVPITAAVTLAIVAVAKLFL